MITALILKKIEIAIGIAIEIDSFEELRYRYR